MTFHVVARFVGRLCSLRLLLANAGPARGAGTGLARRGSWRRSRSRRRRTLTPYRPGWFERKLLAIEQAGGFGVARGLSSPSATSNAASGPSLGPAYGQDVRERRRVHRQGGVSRSRNAKVAQVSLQSPRSCTAVDSRSQHASAGRTCRSRLPWPRPPACEPDRHWYAETKTEVERQRGFRPVRLLRFGAGSAPATLRHRRAHGRDPANRIGLFAGSAGRRRRSATTSTLRLCRDRFARRPTATAVMAACCARRFTTTASRTTGPYSFRRLDGVAEQYVPILHGNWVLYFGLRGSTTTTDAGRQVPFFLMPDLGGHDLRGYANYRFRDLHSILLTAEYRWYAQEFLDAAIFYDAGKAVSDRGRSSTSRPQAVVSAPASGCTDRARPCSARSRAQPRGHAAHHRVQSGGKLVAQCVVLSTLSIAAALAASSTALPWRTPPGPPSAQRARTGTRFL